MVARLVRCGLSASVCAVVFASVAFGEMVNLTSSAPTLTWDRSSSPSGSGTLTLGVENASPPGAGDFWGYTVSLRMALLSGNGTLGIGSATNPATNPVFTDPAGEPRITYNANYTAIANESDGYVNIVVPESGLNLFDLTFASSDALGSFQLIASASRSSYTDVDGNEYSFNNVGSDLVLATINVVPEPGTLAALGSGCMALAGIFWYRRRARKSLRRPRK